MWGIVGDPIKLIYGLEYTGGDSGKNGELLTRVYNQNKTFEFYANQKELKNIGEIYMDFVEKNQNIVPKEHLKILREKKLKKLKNK
jgi:hypothetical protein